ncbi:hypothetical protein PTKIN_Ptkin04bG0201500 [Pterospermum kingtungense]
MPLATSVKDVIDKGNTLPQILFTLLIALAAVHLLPLSYNKLISKSKVKLPPGPYGVPFIGYLPFLGRNIHQTFMELAKIYGPIFKLSIGQRLCVIISSPPLAKEVVRDLDITFANRNPVVRFPPCGAHTNC